MANAEFCLILGLFALMSLLISLTESRRNYMDDLGIEIGPGTEDLSTYIDDAEFSDSGEPVYLHDFPRDFIFGAASSAFQVEGAKKGSGRGLTIWDEFTHMFPYKTINNGDADLALDFYNRYKEDVLLMKDLNVNGFRFSISWTRILPDGRESEEAPVNEEGVKFYNNLIDELLAKNITPAVTLFHWETPLALEMEYRGFLDRRIVEDFRKFAKICFERFGDRVKNWATFNEPSVFSVAGYSRGKKAPGRCSNGVAYSSIEVPENYDKTCVTGDSSVEPYIVGHHQILAHLAAVEEFRKCAKYKEGGDGKIGNVLLSHWFLPQNPKSITDKLARVRSLEFLLGWFLHPLTYGDYPKIMKKELKDRLPSFTDEESKRLRDNRMDFLGLNYYGAFFVTPYTHQMIPTDPSQRTYDSDVGVQWIANETVSVTPYKKTSREILIDPKGLRHLLKYIKDNYQDPDVYIMENGMEMHDDGSISLEDALNNNGTAEFIKSHIFILDKAIRRDGAKVKGYFVWSLMDDFEWNGGYNARFGFYYVDYKNGGLKRHMKKSGEWLKKFLNNEFPIRKCVLLTHREKGLLPQLFPEELREEDDFIRENVISVRGDFM